MLPRTHPKTAIQVFQKISNKLDGNTTYNTFDGDVIGVVTTPQDNELIIYCGTAIADDTINHNIDVDKQYGFQNGANWTFYIDYKGGCNITKELLPELYVRYNTVHNCQEFTLSKPYTELKVLEVGTPNGIRLKHIQLNCKTSS